MRRFVIVLLILSMLLPYTVFAARIESSEISDAAYALVDEMWQELLTAEKRGRTDAENAKNVAALVQENELYVDNTLRWNGEDHFTFETTTGVTCGYSGRLREIARNVEADEVALAEPSVQTNGKKNASDQVFLIEPYYGIDTDFGIQYQKEVKSLAETMCGGYTVYMREAATVDAIADAIEDGKIVIFDSHGETDYARGTDYTTGAVTSYILLQTGTGLTASDYAYDYQMDTYHAVNYGNDGDMYYYAVDGTCIANHMDKTATNSLLWMAICLGMATDGLQAPLRAKGVEVAYGYSQSVTFHYDYKWEEVFFGELKKGKTVAEAIASMKAKIGAWDWCHEYRTVSVARANDAAFPIVVSTQDVYPGHGFVDNLQTVYSKWTLSGENAECLHTNQKTDTRVATCTVDGFQETYCVDCGKILAANILPATGHSYVNGVCEVCGEAEPVCEHQIVDDRCQICGAFCVYVGKTINVYAYSQETSFIGYKWAIKESAFVQLLNEKRYTEVVDGALEFRFGVDVKGLAVGKTTLTLYDDHSQVWTSADIAVLPATIENHEHTWDTGKTIVEATCLTEGEAVFTCTFCSETMSAVLPALGHDYQRQMLIEPTCVSTGMERFTCGRCADLYERVMEKTEHHFVENLCDECGGICVVVGQTLELCSDFYDESAYTSVWQLRNDSLAELSNPRYEHRVFNGRDAILYYIYVSGIAAGETEIYVLTALGEELFPTPLYILPANVHVHNYSVTELEATCTSDGATVYDCDCGESYLIPGEPSFGHSFASGFCTHCGMLQPGAEFMNPFADVKVTDYFYDPVLWAVGNGITNGTSATTFSPEAACTRGQIVTFLWRACGSPEPMSMSNPFKDVKAGEYYYKAVLWAVENGITTGLSATSFGPNATCTRGQVATFLWRSCGEQAPMNANNPFVDVGIEDYYYSAVLWAVENNVTQGVGGGKFAPDVSCTRGQIVTFLYRAIA